MKKKGGVPFDPQNRLCWGVRGPACTKAMGDGDFNNEGHWARFNEKADGIPPSIIISSTVFLSQPKQLSSENDEVFAGLLAK